MDNTILENKKTVDFFDGMLDYFECLNRLQAKVGVHSDAGQDNVNKAKWNEFGTNHILKYNSIAIQGEGLKPLGTNTYRSLGEDNIIVNKGADISIPARPFIRLYLYPESVDKLMKRFVNSFGENLYKSKMSRQDAENTFEALGKESVHLMKQKMYYGNYDKGSNKTIKDQEHNSLLTQYIKGKDSPLIDSGELASSLDYKIEIRGV